MLFWLTPIAANLNISLYLTISFPFSRWSSAPLWRQIDSRKGKSPETGLWISAKRGTPIGATWNSYRLCVLYAKMAESVPEDPDDGAYLRGSGYYQNLDQEDAEGDDE